MIKKITDKFKRIGFVKAVKGISVFAVMFALRKGIATGIVTIAMAVMKGSTVASPGALFCEMEYPEM